MATRSVALAALPPPAPRARPFSPSSLTGFVACEHRAGLERAREAGLVHKPHFADSALEALVERGRQHERAFLEELRATKGSVIEIDTRDLKTPGALVLAAQQTRAAMQSGADVIYQATFFDGTWRGHADFLVRVERPSNLGAWSYEPWDTKLSREPRASALLQLCAYAEMVELVQGISPESMHVVLGGPERRVETFRVAAVAPYYRRVRRELVSFMARGAPVFPVIAPYPEPVEHCNVCDWSPLCDKRRREDDDLSLVAGISRKQTKALKERGVGTLEALAGLRLPITPALEGTSSAALERVVRQAWVQREGRRLKKPIYEFVDSLEEGTGLEALPAPSGGDLFFDIEGDPFVGNGGREYLFGLVDVSGDYQGLWAFDAATEQTQFEAVIDRITARRRSHPDMHVYHYAPYEPSAFKRLAARLGSRVDELDELLRGGVFVDLFRVVRQAIRASVESYSIKKLEVFYGFSREQELRAAGDARATLELWLESGNTQPLENHETIRTLVERYNRDDCVSAAKLRGWLEELRAELARVKGLELARPSPPAAEASEERTQIRAELEALKRRLLDRLPLEERNDEQQAQWLVAQLLEWHWREDKSAWWDFFRMTELSAQELIEDPRPIGGVRYEGPAGSVKRSMRHRYSFPPQEHDLSKDTTCVQPTSGKQIKFHAFDAAARTFEVTRKLGEPAPEIASLIPNDIVRTDSQRDRLRDLAEWVAAEGISSRKRDRRLARDLLLRAPPCAAASSLVREGESASDAAVRLVLELAGSQRGGVLPIQGPPGSGKTHTGAAMILELVRKGFKVGVTANSHKVICNLLKKACAQARESGDALRIVQRADEGQGLVDNFVTLLPASEMQAALAAAQTQVGAGTSWLWSSLGAGAVDVLFVDEAGQMSLANVVSMAHCARVLVMLGDPLQLDQPRKGVHPPGAEVSALEHALGGATTMPAERGLFLETTWRLHPALCAFTSDTVSVHCTVNQAV